jgi:hypothetical protein
MALGWAHFALSGEEGLMAEHRAEPPPAGRRQEMEGCAENAHFVFYVLSPPAKAEYLE